MGAKRDYRNSDLLYVARVLYLQYLHFVLHRRNFIRRGIFVNSENHVTRNRSACNECRILMFPLMLQCRKVGESTYMINWYLLPEKKALSLILIFAISNSSIKLTAGKLVELSLSNFCSVNNTRLSIGSLP